MLSQEEKTFLTEYARARMSEKRFRHSMSVAETAEKIAVLTGADPDEAVRAGILHDTTKEWDDAEQLRYCRERGIILREDERCSPKVLHAITAADVISRELKVSPEVVSAVRWHCTAHAGMTPLETTVFLADYTEPFRTHEVCIKGAEVLRREGVTAAMCYVLSTEIRHQIERNAVLCLYTAEARNDWIRAGEAAPARKEPQ